MLRGAIIVIVGFVSMALIVMLGTLALMALIVPGGMAAMRDARTKGMPLPPPTARYIVSNIILSFGAAIFGGLVVAHLARAQRDTHLAALGALILAMGALSARAPGSERQPLWYKMLIPVIGVAGVAASALLTPR